MDAEFALLDDPLDFRNPYFPGVVTFERTPHIETQIGNCKHNGLEDPPVALIERAVDENLIGIRSRRHDQAGWSVRRLSVNFPTTR